MSSDAIKHLDTQSFDAAIGADMPVLVDFWAPWCGPCKAIAPILDELAGEFGDKVSICKVDVDNNSELAGRYNIRAIPTLLIFKGGQKVDEVVGMANKTDLKSKLEAQL